jgi:hypothetical protein
MMIKQSLLISLVSIWAGLWMAGCSGATDSTGTTANNLKGGQSAQHLEDASDNDKDEGGMARGTGNGQGAHSGMGMSDGKDCKPADGGPSPCARGDGGDDNEDADNNDNADDNEDASDHEDGHGRGKCASLDGGPSPCSEGHENDH